MQDFEGALAKLSDLWANIEAVAPVDLAAAESTLLQGRGGGPAAVGLRLVVAFSRFEDEAGVLAPWVRDLVNALPDGPGRELARRYVR